MPDSVVTQWRLLYLDDLSKATVLATTTATIGGLGSVTVTPFFTASGDAGAAALGLAIGDVYVNTAVTPNRLRTRMS